MVFAKKSYVSVLVIAALLMVTSAVAAQDEPINTTMPDGDKVLAWVAPGEAPGLQGASTPGELVFFNSDGSMESIMALPNQTTRVMPCGGDATSPNGEHFALLTSVTAGGRETGTLHMMDGQNPELSVITPETNVAICNGENFQWAPDSSRFGTLDLGFDATEEQSPRGFLRIYNSADKSEITSFDSVTGFELTNNGAAFISFFVNDDNRATEVGLFSWDGTVDREVATLFADEENRCYYTSGSISTLGDSGNLAALLGYRCLRGDNTSTQWQLYFVNPEERTAEQVASSNAGGAFFPFTANNSIYASSDGASVYFTVPDGVTNQSVSLLSTSVSEVNVNTVIENSALVPNASDTPYDYSRNFDTNQVATQSPDRNWLGIVQVTPNGDATLNVLDLSQPELPPIEIDAGDQGDSISEMVFTPDGSQLVYVAGGDYDPTQEVARNNSLFLLDTETGSETRVRRGRYAQGALSPDGSQMALMNWQLFSEEEPPYLTLNIVTLADSAEATIWEGGEVDDEGELVNQRFAFPLAWRAAPGSSDEGE